MATGTRGGGPGSYSQNGVRCTMDAPFDKSASAKTGTGPGLDGQNKAPFNKPQSMGGGSIPTRFFDTSMSAKPANGSSSAGASSVLGITKRNPSERRFKHS